FTEIKGRVEVELTGATGEFTARAYNPTGSLKGFWDLRENLTAGKQRFAPAHVRIAAAPFPGVQVTELALDEPRALAGRVLLENGRPLLRGTVTIDRWNGSEAIRLTEEITAGGMFSFSGLPDG